MLLVESLIIGLCIGSFLNVVVYRLPIMMLKCWRNECQEFLSEQFALTNPEKTGCCPVCETPNTSIKEPDNTPFNLAVPKSRCPKCQNPVPVWGNIPVLSYLFLRGRCHYCQCHISLRYPIVELFTGLLTLGLTYYYGLTPMLAGALIFSYGLIIVTLIDIDHQFIPDEVTYSLLWLGLLFNTQHLFAELNAAIIGAVAGYLSLWSVYQLFKLATGKEGMGHGDFKLLAMLGAWLGWQQLPFVILCSSILGTIFGLLFMLRGADKDMPFAFGPYLAVAGFIALFYGDTITSWYLSHYI